MLEKTLADYASRPHTRPLEFGDIKVPDIVKNYRDYRLSAGMAQPEEVAIEFYLLNGAAARLSQEVDKNVPLTTAQEHLLGIYYDSLQIIGHRAFFYLLLICTRETRHCGLTPKLTESCEPLGAYNFWKKLKGLESKEAVQKLLDIPPEVSLKNYTEHMVNCFTYGTHKGGYAGPAWVAVAKPLRDFVHGTISMEVLLDTVWTLAHNNGPIFNKGMLFNNYGAELQKILDVQRAGQVANLVYFKESSHVNVHHQALLALCQKALPDFGSEAVNWQKVKELGAKTNWAPKVGIKYGTSILENIPKVASADITLDSKIQITPIEFVKKITRKEAKK